MEIITARDFTNSITELEDALVANTDTLERLLYLKRQQQKQHEVEDGVFKRVLNKIRASEENLGIRSDRVAIEIRLIFLKIGEIETQKEQFEADVFIQIRWREPRLDDVPCESFSSIDHSKLWNPDLFIENSLGKPFESVWGVIALDDKGRTYVYERRRVKGCFAETLELADFPFDVQDLTVTLSSRRPDTELELMQDREEQSAVYSGIPDQQEWHLHRTIETTSRVTMSEYSSSKQNYPSFSVTCRASRRPGYFYWNVFFIMFLISSLSFATFSVKPELPQFRLNLAFTLVLTSVAFKFVINQNLPRISYLTYLDKYVLGSMVILVIVCIWHCVVTFDTIRNSAASGAQKQNSNEKYWAFKSFAIAYVGFHLGFALWLYYDPCKRRRTMNRQDKDLERAVGPMKYDMLELYGIMEDTTVIKR